MPCRRSAELYPTSPPSSEKQASPPLHASPYSLCSASLFQGPPSLTFEDDPQQPPLELAVRRVSSSARSAQEKVSGVVLTREADLRLRGACVRRFEKVDAFR